MRIFSQKTRGRIPHCLWVFLIFFFFGACLAYGEGSVLKTISPKASYQLIQQNEKDPGFVILDVRTPYEFKGGHIKGAVLIDYYSSTFVNDLKELSREKTYLIYCRSGNRSQKTLKLFAELGFSHAYNMAKGIKGWKTEGFPIFR